MIDHQEKQFIIKISVLTMVDNEKHGDSENHLMTLLTQDLGLDHRQIFKSIKKALQELGVVMMS